LAAVRASKNARVGYNNKSEGHTQAVVVVGKCTITHKVARNNNNSQTSELETSE